MKEIKDDTNRWREISYLEWKNQYCEDVYAAKSNLQIQCNFYQITSGIFHRTRTTKFIFCMETQNTPHSNINLEKE